MIFDLLFMFEFDVRLFCLWFVNVYGKVLLIE